MSRCVGLLLQILSFQFDCDISAKLSSFDRPVRDYGVQSRKTVDDNLKMGVVILGMHDSRVKEHTARLESWIKTRDEILEIERTQLYINSHPAPMQLAAAHKGKGKGKEKGKAKATQQPPPPCFHCTKKAHVRSDCRPRQKDLWRKGGQWLLRLQLMCKFGTMRQT